MKRRLALYELKIVMYGSIILIIFLIIFSVAFCNNNNIDSYNISKNNLKKSETISFPGERMVHVYRGENQKIEAIDVDEYIKCVLACEMPANFHIEALKAQAIAARTFYFSKRLSNCTNAKGAEICDSVHCQVYKSKEECLLKWNKNDKNNYWSKISEAVDNTKDMVLTYEDKIVEYPQFFATSWGKTEDSKDVFSTNIPYLKSVESKGEEVAPKYSSSVKINLNDFINKVNKNYIDACLSKETVLSNVMIESYTKSGSVKKIRLGKINITGKDFRKLFNLNSPKFEIYINDNVVNINCTGYGHGLGMSQWGANIMAKSGKGYKEILEHYYKGVKIGKVKFED